MGIISRMRRTARKVQTPVKLTDLETGETRSFRLQGYCNNNLAALAALAEAAIGDVKVKASNVQVSAAVRKGEGSVQDGGSLREHILTAHMTDEQYDDYARAETAKRDAARDAARAAEAKSAKGLEDARLASIAALAEAAAKVPAIVQERIEASPPSNGQGKPSKASK